MFLYQRHHDDGEHGAHDDGQRDGPDGLRDDLGVGHQPHGGRHEEHRHVLGDDRGRVLHHAGLDELEEQAQEQQYHADDAARYETVDKHAGHFAQEVEQQDEKQTFYHDEQ